MTLVNRLARDWQADAESKRRALNNVKGMAAESQCDGMSAGGES
jgi:hypothetical protein